MFKKENRRDKYGLMYDRAETKIMNLDLDEEDDKTYKEVQYSQKRRI